MNVLSLSPCHSLILSQAAGFPEPEIVHYNPKEFDFGKKKAFPFRDQVKKNIHRKEKEPVSPS